MWRLSIPSGCRVSSKSTVLGGLTFLPHGPIFFLHGPILRLHHFHHLYSSIVFPSLSIFPLLRHFLLLSPRILVVSLSLLHILSIILCRLASPFPPLLCRRP